MISNFIQGQSVPLAYQITRNGVNPDITGDGVNIKVKAKKSDLDAAAVINKNFDVTTQGASGICSIELTPTETKALTVGFYFFEVWWTLSGGEQFPLDGGNFEVLARVGDNV